MLQWLNPNNYPEFWKNYLSKIKEKSNRYVAISIESSGLNSSKDVILAFSAITITADKIAIKDCIELYVSYANSECGVPRAAAGSNFLWRNQRQ